MNNSTSSIDTNDSIKKKCSPVDDDKPLIQLFKCLINDRDKQNTVLTNTQVIDILQKEFNVKVVKMHVLELDIYMTVMKKYLKVWPEWDEFDRIIGNLKTNDDFKTLDDVLTEKYNSLKTYLKDILEYSRPSAQEMVKKVVNDSTKPNTKEKEKKVEAEDVVMEIQCTRTQLNQLFSRHPNPEHNNSIFNISDYAGPSRISLNTLSLKSIFNWSLVSVSINLNFFLYKRETLHRMRHTLINKIIQPNIREPPVLDTDLYEKELQKLQTHSREALEKFLNKVVNGMIKKNPSLKNLINTVFDLVKDDFKNLPKKIKVPGKFKRIANRYPYVRYLYDEPKVGTDKDKYDLQLEERITPTFHYYIGKAAMLAPENPMNISNDWLRIECIYCQVKFFGVNVIDNIQQHFNEVHQQEHDWQCMNCHKTFTMAYLSENKWYHRC